MSSAAQPVVELLKMPVDDLVPRAVELVERAFAEGDADAEDTVQRLFYQLNVLSILPPWDPSYWPTVNTVEIAHLKRSIDAAWLDHEVGKYREAVAQELSSTTFEEWATRMCVGHASGPAHPLFGFLAETADREQLREFLYHETPLDIHFPELLSMLFPGIHGMPELELLHNFWFEMGHGAAGRAHRELRGNAMRVVGLDPRCHLTDVDHFWIEEIRLANMYFQACSNRALAPQAMGMLLATELMVPGRIDRQVEGWKRVGVAESDIGYLVEHLTVGEERGQGWKDTVVAPLLAEHPDLAVDVAVGVQRRLDTSLAVCRRAASELIG
ncbi:iron-containing redox enzyme family protein [Streptomyces xanthophaeus]